MKKTIVIIDKEIILKYNEWYFAKYPKRRKPPIEKPIPPSLNKYIAMRRLAQNNIKQKYKEFSIWLASYYQIANLNLDKLRMVYKFYFGDKRRRDMDNLLLSPKFLNDGFVDSNVLKDDNGEILRIEFDNFGYDRENPRLEITLFYEEN
jgi:Holliday junction resolvase RusA-like endonuclease